MPPWPPEQAQALAGRCRGALLRDWAAHLRRDFGDDAVVRLRDALGLTPRQLPDAPVRKAWYPVGHQIAITRWVGETLLDGDLLALEPLLFTATHGARDRVIEWAMATVGVSFVFRQGERLHGWLYDRGRVRCTVQRNNARFDWSGAEFFGNPTWRLLQCFAVRATVRSLGREVVELTAFDPGPARYSLAVTWR